MAKKKGKVPVEDDVVYDEAEDEEDKKEWVEDEKAAAPEPERYDTPERLAEAAKAKEAEQKEQPPVPPNYDLGLNPQPVKPDKKED